jgi:hypothetical protein
VSEQRRSSPEYFNGQFVLRTCITNVTSEENIEFEAISIYGRAWLKI